MENISTKEEQFDSIYRAYGERIFQVCLHYTHDYDAASDLLHQTFLSFYNHMDEIEPGYVKAYLARSVRNKYLNSLRLVQREIDMETYRSELNSEELMTENLEDAYFEKKRRGMECKLGKEIFNDLKEHNESWYQIYYKSCEEQKTYEEISDELGLTSDVLYSKIYRAKRWVQKHYRKKYDNISDEA